MRSYFRTGSFHSARLFAFARKKMQIRVPGMNINPVVRFGLVPLTAGVAFAVGYALIANPVSSAGARIALPASGQDAQEHSLSYQAGTDAAPDD